MPETPVEKLGSTEKGLAKATGLVVKDFKGVIGFSGLIWVGSLIGLIVIGYKYPRSF